MLLSSPLYHSFKGLLPSLSLFKGMHNTKQKQETRVTGQRESHHLRSGKKSRSCKAVRHDSLNVDVLVFSRAPEFEKDEFARSVSHCQQ